MRGPLYQPDYRHQFSGHETFPIRYGWLKKAFDSVVVLEDHLETRQVFAAEDAIARFGVGKNMVSSMRHWAMASGILAESQRGAHIEVTAIGKKLLSDDGLDPYMESPSTLWIVHWHLAGRPTKTTWFWAFNHFNNVTFDRDHLVHGLNSLAEEREWKRIATATIKRDVDCFVRSYAV